MKSILNKIQYIKYLLKFAIVFACCYFVVFIPIIFFKINFGIKLVLFDKIYLYPLLTVISLIIVFFLIYVKFKILSNVLSNQTLFFILLFFFPILSSEYVCNNSFILKSDIYGASLLSIFTSPDCSNYDGKLHENLGSVFVGLKYIIHPTHHFQIIHLSLLVIIPLVIYIFFKMTTQKRNK